MNQAPAATFAPAIKTFSALYNLASHDPVILTRQLNLFDVNVQGAVTLTPAETISRLNALTLEGSPCPLLVLETDPSSPLGVIRLYHAPAICPNLTDRPHHEWMDRSFVSHGEIFNKETDIYESGDYAHLANVGTAVVCLGPPQIDAAFTNDPIAQSLGPFLVAEPNTTAIRVRRSCFVPPRLAARFLSEVFTPREAWNTIQNLISQEPQDIRDTCAPLTRWLQYVLHLPSAAATHSPARMDRFAATTGRQIREHRCKINFRFLPALDETSMARAEAHLLAAKVGEVAAQLQLQTEEQRAASDEKKRKRTVGEKWPELLSNLLNLAQVPEEKDLENIWLRLAGSKKDDARVIIEGVFEQSCQSLRGASRNLKFPVESAFAAMITNIRLRMTHHDDLTTGLQPFAIGQVTAEATARAAARALKMDQASAAGVNLSLTDISSLSTLLVKDQVPLNAFDALKTIRIIYVA